FRSLTRSHSAIPPSDFFGFSLRHPAAVGALEVGSAIGGVPVTEQELFVEAFQIADPASRERFLDRACETDPALRQRVAGLMVALGRAGNFLEEPAAVACTPGVTSAFRPEDAHEGPGSVIGPYKLLEQIGEGGFGIVFMAEQQHPVRRKVALKVLKPGM